MHQDPPGPGARPDPTASAPARTPEITPRLILISLLALAVTVLLLPTSARAGTRAEQNDDYGLMFETEKPGVYVPAPLLAADVRIDVTGMISRVRVRQFYQNPTEGWLEGRYVFPLPEKSAVDALTLQIGDRLVKGVIEERQRARAKYETAKQDGKKAALLESERPNIFTTSVANIGPNETVVVEFEYQEAIRYTDGEFRLRFPMVVGPRYIPGSPVSSPKQLVSYAPNTTQVPDAERITPPVLPPEAGKINPVNLLVHLNGGASLSQIVSHHHDVSQSVNPDGSIDVTFREGPVAADSDFELTWRAGRSEADLFAFREGKEDADYAVFLLVPPAPEAMVEREDSTPREFIFVIDTSGSMGGESIRQARAALLQGLAGIRSMDRFNVIQFNSVMQALFPAAVPANSRNIDLARGYIAGLTANGGTEMARALSFALDGVEDPSRLRQVVFITDGAVGNEAQLFRLIDSRLGDSRLFTVGIGSAPNSHFMHGAADMGRGAFTYIGSPDEVQQRMAGLWRKIMTPVVTNIRVTGLDGQHAELWPQPLPDLFANEPVVMALRWLPGIERVRFDGSAGGRPWSREVRLDTLPTGTGIAKLWAREKIAAIENSEYRGADAEEVRQEILNVALLHGLVTKYTSLVAIDQTPSRGADDKLVSATVPTNLPDGWVYEKVFGEKASGEFQQWKKTQLESFRSRFAGTSMDLKTASAPPDAAPGTAEAAPTRPVALPQTATPAHLLMFIGSLLIALALLLLARTRAFRGFGC